MEKSTASEIASFIASHSHAFDPEKDLYEKPAYNESVQAGKNTPIYNAHSYHTKVPYQGIIPFIEHYTEPGNLILDPFCGSGMTGVAALLSPSGPRNVILNDLSPAAVHIARNYCTPCDVTALKQVFERIKAAVKKEFDWLYETFHEDRETGKLIPATIQYTIWSDVYQCRPKKMDVKKHNINPAGCGGDIILWDVAVDHKMGQVKESFSCPYCHETWKKAELSLLRTIPVVTNYTYTDKKTGKKKREDHPVTDIERQRLLEIEGKVIPYWYPTTPFDNTREMWRGVHRDAGITRACEFYTKRNLWALSMLWNKFGSVSSLSVRNKFYFALTAIFGVASKRNRWPQFQTLSGNLYIPSISIEMNILGQLGRRIKVITESEKEKASCKNWTGAIISKGSATDLSSIMNESVDYIFTDPPFGSNIFYSDCSFLWESWLGEFTENDKEAVWNKRRTPDEGGKSLDGYKGLMVESFREMYRVLKPNRWATVVFSNSDDKVWEAIQDAAHHAGFVVYGGKEFDKMQRSFKGIRGEKGQEKVISKDVLLNLHKPLKPQVRNVDLAHVEDVEGFVLLQVKQYLQYLSLDSPHSERTIEAITRRVQRQVLEQGYSMRGFSAGFVADVLHEAQRRFTLFERDGAWYPANGGLEKLEVRDEKSAITWLTNILLKGPKRLDELDPLWKQERLKGNYRGHRSLQELLEDFFIKNPDGAFRRPDEHEQQILRGQDDAEQLRRCERYLEGKLTEAPLLEEKFKWIDLLKKREKWQTIIDLERTLIAMVDWGKMPGGKEAKQQIGLAKMKLHQKKDTAIPKEQASLF